MSASVLVVEDEGVVAKDVETTLTRLGYTVVGWVTTGEAAIEEALRTRPDLVLMDIRLGGRLDGIQAADAVRRLHDTPIVYLTAYADDVTLRRAVATEPFGYVVKPFSERELHTAVEIALYKHRAEGELRRRERWLETTLGSIDDAVVATDRNGAVAYLNQRAEATTGWSRDEAIGRPISEIFTLDAADGGTMAHAVGAAISGRREIVIDDSVRLVARDGDETPVGDATVPLVVTPIIDQDDVLGAVAVFRDLTDKQVAEATTRRLVRELEQTNLDLEKQRGFLGALFHCVPSPVMVVDPDLRIVMVNRSFADTYGLDGNTLTGLDLGIANVLGCPHGDERTGDCGSTDDCQTCGLIRLVQSAFDGTPTCRTRCRIERRNGHFREMSLHVSVAPLEHAARQLAIVVLEDTTELNGYRRLMGVEKSFAGLVGAHASMLEVYENIREIADTDVPVMVLGESGTGKELVARAIHDMSTRAAYPFVPVNCGAIPDGLLESELFGHVKGAFTGAIRDRRGRFELADRGTIFLDEIGDLSPRMQVKLLRVLQEGTFERVGGEETVTVDVRAVCATNRDLAREATEGRFRQDLYYRLCVVPITMPPLRDRVSDVPMLAEHLLERYAVASVRSTPELSLEVIQRLTEHSWPGNVRELQNVLQFALVTCKGDHIELHHLPPDLRGHVAGPTGQRTGTGGRGSKALDRTSVTHALRTTGGNRTRAAEVLGVSRATLYRFLRDHPDTATAKEDPHA